MGGLVWYRTIPGWRCYRVVVFYRALEIRIKEKAFRRELTACHLYS